jgi:hypothetical protein
MIKLFSKLATEDKLAKQKEDITLLQKQELITSPKTLIENNRMLLAFEPDGDFIWNSALVFDADDIAEVYGGIVVEMFEDKFYAKFEDDAVVDGLHGIVSYISRITR